MTGPDGVNYLNILPDFTNNWDMAVAVFIMPIAVQWWAVWYPGAEPGGGSYIAQRMLASKSEKDSLGAVLFFNVAHYVLRPWPWILVGAVLAHRLPGAVRHPARFPNLDPNLLGHDIAYPAMLKFLPVGFIGLMVGGLIAANSSTILTHLNWGASYLVHDFYRRFIKQGRHREALRAGGPRWPPWSCSCCSSAHWSSCSKRPRTISTSCSRSAPAPGCSTGALVLVAGQRLVRGRGDGQFVPASRSCCWCSPGTACTSAPTSALLVTIAVTTVCWVATAYLGPQTDRKTLVEFYTKVRPFGPGWKRDPRGGRPRRGRGAHGRARTSRWRCSAGWRAAR